jgi:hypothetical protein
VDEATPEETQKALGGREGYRIDLSRLDEAVAALAAKLVERFPECTRYTKEQVNFWKGLAWHQTIGHARDWLSVHFTTAEPFEGMRAFVEKRRPRIQRIREKAAEGGAPEFLWGPPSRTCRACGARDLPQEFSFCGICGAVFDES